MSFQQTSKTAITISRVLGIISSICGYATAFLFSLPLLTGALKSAPQVIVALILIVMGLLLIINGIKTKKRITRFKEYVNIISLKNETSIENIASAYSSSVDFVTKDLQKMISKKFFINAYIDKNTNEIVLERKNTSDANKVITNNETVEFKDVTCKNCGASNKIQANSTTECEFCGSVIN